VLTPKQFGRAVVQSYPFYLDGAVLVELLATDGQGPPGAPPASLPPVRPTTSELLPNPVSLPIMYTVTLLDTRCGHSIITLVLRLPWA
jgi:hypothetical protein